MAFAGAVMVVGVEGRMRSVARETMGFMGFLLAEWPETTRFCFRILSALLIGGLTVAGNGMEINTASGGDTQILIMLCSLPDNYDGGSERKRHERIRQRFSFVFVMQELPIIYALLGDLIGQRTGITSLSVEGKHAGQLAHV